MNIKIHTKRRALVAFMLDQPGVLNKVSMLIRRKMYNVDTITVCKTRTLGISRMTLTLCEDSDDKLNQVLKQIEKMTEVISAKELDIDQSFWREVGLVKFEADKDHFKQLSEHYSFDILDRQNHEIYIVQLSGTSKTIDDFLKDIGDEKIIDMARSGLTTLEK
ncbi:MAG: acetolactate synthase small subunit [Proteobacteria bacterium]|nr:acetolactate synthase small subunit [Pseudomonadota bacterium]